jgi:transcriptional regulator with PAS, ATPase and Fis domain
MKSQDGSFAVDKTLPSSKLRRPLSSPARRESSGGDPLDKIIGDTPSMEKLREKLRQYASLEAPVLLLGESGTGKDLAARCLHYHSPRKKGPFVVFNCAAIPGTLFESEIFGSERGAFTDAVSHPGKFEQADGGTIFLDEIGETPLEAQVKLLRILENKTLVRLGGAYEMALDFRFISATNENLRDMVKNKRFRLDLLYRINTIFLEIPPLRKRHGDIEILAFHFLSQLPGQGEKYFSPNALEKLFIHTWPGNVRELKNVVERAAYNSRSEKIMAQEITFF